MARSTWPEGDENARQRRRTMSSSDQRCCSLQTRNDGSGLIGDVRVEMEGIGEREQRIGLRHNLSKLFVLTNNTGTEAIQGIVLKLLESKELHRTTLERSKVF
nr:hypothetical protein CFP56_70262 [Quercus suber]